MWNLIVEQTKVSLLAILLLCACCANTIQYNITFGALFLFLLWWFLRNEPHKPGAFQQVDLKYSQRCYKCWNCNEKNIID